MLATSCGTQCGSCDRCSATLSRESLLGDAAGTMEEAHLGFLTRFAPYIYLLVSGS